MQKLSHRTQSFEGFTLDQTRGCLFRGSQEIKLPPKPFDALKYLVDNAGRLVSKAELIQELWPDTAVTDDSLVQCLMEVRRALDDGTQQIIKTVPRRGYIFDRVVIDSGDSGQGTTYTEETAGVNVIIEEEETNERGDAKVLPLAPTKTTYLIDAIKQHKLRVVFGVLTLAVAVVAVALVYFTRPAKAIDSVAVMPVENLSGDPNTDYLSEGISESITNNLSPLLKVSSTASVLRYKGKQMDPRVVGQELNVEALLITRILQHGDDVSISAELVDATDNHRLWGQKYDSKMANIISLQQNFLRDISERLRPGLSSNEQQQFPKKYTGSSEALDAYWQGRYHARKLTPAELQESIRYFNRAIELDPSFALPYTGLASSYSMLGARGTLSPTEAYPKAVAAATKAVELDDTLAEAHYAQAKVKRDDWDLVGFEKELKRAIELNGNYVEAHHNYSHLLIALGRTAESLSESKRLLEIDPLDLTLNAHLGWYYLVTRQYDQAIEKCLGTLGKGENFWAHYYLGRAYEQTGRYEEAISEFKKAIPLSKGNPEATAALGHAYAVSGKENEARKVLEELNDNSKHRYVSPDYRALIYAGLGDKNAAFEQLQKAYDEHAGQLIYVNVDQRFDSMHSDARFQDLCRRVGLSR